MKAFLSYAWKDVALAQRLAQMLKRAGVDAWISEEQIVPGDNWAKKIGKALDDSDLMVILLTPGAMGYEDLRRDIEFALGSKKYEKRVYSVFVGPTLEAGKDIPWILLSLPHDQIESAKDFGQAVKSILGLPAASNLSHANA